MASLRSMIRDGKFGLGWDGKHFIEKDTEEILVQHAERVRKILLSPNAILVNAQPVADDIMKIKEGEMIRFDSIPCPKPPFRIMWLEAKLGFIGGHCEDCGAETVMRRVGAMVGRYDGPEFMRKLTGGMEICETSMAGRMLRDDPTDVIQAIMWFEIDGYALYMGRIYWWLDKDGKYLDGAFLPVTEEFSSELAWLLNSFARMNCHNVKLVPQTAGGPRIKKGKPHPPFSYWHEIVVATLPELRREQKGEIAVDGEKRELRFHKVRGHYADYTQGKGLFGKYKVRIWIEEHSAGDRELGTVVSSYAVK